MIYKLNLFHEMQKATWAHRAALISISLVLGQTPANSVRSRIRSYCTVLCLFASSGFTGTQCTDARRDGQAELAWMVG